MQDMLDTQFNAQLDHHGMNFKTLTDEERIEAVRWNMLALQDELHEALAEVGWKPWATSRHINREAYIAELVDAWHFFMNLLLLVDATEVELRRGYFDKRHRNNKRQAEGYDGVSDKCRVCGRALDDPAVVCTEKECKS